MKVARVVWSHLKKYIPNSLRQKIKELDAKDVQIVQNPETKYDNVCHIKDATWETVVMPEVWGMSKQYSCTMKHPAQDILLIKEACVFPSSDIVLTNDGVVWDKNAYTIYPYTIPLDGCLSSYGAKSVRLRNMDTVLHVDGGCVSMLGVFDDIWTHFIMQFLPKLYYAQEAGLLDMDITVIVPNYKDEQVKELVYNVLKKHSACKVIVHDEKYARVGYQCDILYWIPTASAISNDTKFPSLYHNIIPQRVMQILHKNVFGEYMTSKDRPKYEKIYLVRRSRFRNMTNVDEIEEFFRERGFEFVEPHKYSLIEKISIFRNAKVVAGAHSSAWSNAMFCNHARGLMLTPISWTNDAFLGYNISDEECHIIMVPGVEPEFDGSQNDFMISLQSLQEAYDALLNE